MGFDPWPTYVDNNKILNQAYYMQAANVMHTEKFPVWNGTQETMQQAGYTFDTIDDDWGGKRTARGLQPNLVYFPNMLNPDPNIGLICHVHSLGLKIGLYTSVGDATCLASPQGPIPGSLGHEAIDGAEFQKWGVDYMKLDWCGSGISFSSSWVEALLKKWRRDLGPNIVIATNTGGAGDPWAWASKDNTVNAFRISASISNWRLGAKVTDQWNGGRGSVMGILNDVNSHLQQSHAATHHWSDAGYLHTGVNLTLDESKSEFSMWAMVTSPLIVGADILRMKPGDITSQVIFNTEIIAVDQDPRVVQATQKATIDGVQVWEKPLSNNAYAVAFLNPNSEPASVSVTWSQVGIPTSSMPKRGYYARDLWAHTDLGRFPEGYSATNIPPHGIVVLKVATSSANLLPPATSTNGN
jgi:alpha-galactosidase